MSERKNENFHFYYQTNILSPVRALASAQSAKIFFCIKALIIISLIHTYMCKSKHFETSSKS